MSPVVLIGLTGYAGTGKDTVRAMLEDTGFTGFAFAEPIRGMLRELMTSSGIDDRYMDEREFKEAAIPELGVSYRQIAQTLGTEWGRAQAPDFWLRIANSLMSEQIALGGTHFVVSDVRFANEAQWVRDHGGVIWRVERPEAVPVRAHVSECEMHHFTADVTLHNTGSLKDLYRTVMYALDRGPA